MLVTGGAGFLGSHLIDRLLESGDEVLCVDNLFTGDKSNLDHLASRRSTRGNGIVLSSGKFEGTSDMVILAVPHREYVVRDARELRAHLSLGGTLADLKGALSEADWTL